MITKLETINIDAEEIFKVLKIPKSVGSFPTSNFHSSESISDKDLQNIFKKYPKKLILDLYRHYKEDFILFDYKIDDYLNRDSQSNGDTL